MKYFLKAKINWFKRLNKMASTTESLPELVGGIPTTLPVSKCSREFHLWQKRQVGGGYLVCTACGEEIPNSILENNV